MRIAKNEMTWRISFLEKRDLCLEVSRGFLLEKDSCLKVRAHFPKGPEVKKRLLKGASL
jgi:hypothetical protein